MTPVLEAKNIVRNYYLPGGLFNVRGRVRSQLVDRTRADLARTRAAIEQPVASSGGGH